MTGGPVFGIAGIWQETNTYAPSSTTIEDFRAFELLEGQQVRDSHGGMRTVIGGAMNEFAAQVTFGLSAGAWPSGMLTSEAADELLTRFDAALIAMAPVQGLLLNLHGAMVAEGMDDFEIEIVKLIRERLGSIPIVAVLDLHANPSSQLLRELDGVVAYTTFPHVDMFERGQEAARLLRTLEAVGDRNPVQFKKLPLITSPLSQGTAFNPMKSLRQEVEHSVESLSAFITPGFPYSDVSRGGLTIMVNSLGDSDRQARELVGRLAEVVASRVDEFSIPAVSLETAFEGIAQAEGPVMLVDVGDNIGGGARGDSLALLPGLVANSDMSSVLVVADPHLAERAHLAGVGGRLLLQRPATDPALGDLAWEVTVISNGTYVASGEWMGGKRFEMGPTAVLAHRGVHLVVTTVPTPPFHLAQLTSLGLDPGSFSILTAKGALAWQDAYGDLVRRVIYVDTPGPTPAFPEDQLRLHAFELEDLHWQFPGGRIQRSQDHAHPPVVAGASSSLIIRTR